MTMTDMQYAVSSGRAQWDGGDAVVFNDAPPLRHGEPLATVRVRIIARGRAR